MLGRYFFKKDMLSSWLNTIVGHGMSHWNLFTIFDNLFLQEYWLQLSTLIEKYVQTKEQNETSPTLKRKLILFNDLYRKAHMVCSVCDWTWRFRDGGGRGRLWCWKLRADLNAGTANSHVIHSLFADGNELFYLFIKKKKNKHLLQFRKHSNLNEHN